MASEDGDTEEEFTEADFAKWLRPQLPKSPIYSPINPPRDFGEYNSPVDRVFASEMIAPTGPGTPADASGRAPCA